MPEAPRMLFENHAEFREAVARSRGRVIVIVHPFSSRRYGYYNHERKTYEAESGRKYEDKLKKLVAGAKVPIVIMQEPFDPRTSKQPTDLVADTNQEIGNKNTWFVKTDHADPIPLEGWAKFHELFQSAGVEHILIAGAYAEGYSQEQIERHAPAVYEYEKSFNRPPIRSIGWGCVGLLYDTLISAKYAKPKILPAVVFPDKPQYGERPKLTTWQRLKAILLVKRAKKTK